MSRHPNILDRGQAVLLIIDVQESFRPYAAFAGVAAAAAKLVQAARILAVPVLVSEQYPKGLGHTAPEVGLQDEPRIEKSVMYLDDTPGFGIEFNQKALDKYGTKVV